MVQSKLAFLVLFVGKYLGIFGTIVTPGFWSKIVFVRESTLLLALCACFATASAHDGTLVADAMPPYTVTPIIKQAMSDTGLQGYEMQALRLDLVPGGVDASPHRHDADLFVYVLQGSIEVELDGRRATYAAGTMFHEPRNVLHTLLRNTSSQDPASALAIFVIKAGREAVVPERK